MFPISTIEVEIIQRILVSLVLGLIIGIERQWIKTETKTIGSAGLRTHTLVTIGTTLVTATGALLFPQDPIRLAASIMAGIGFIGAGTVMASRKGIIGLTNAASIWVAASIGIAVGVGFYVSSLIATILAVIILELRKFEKVD